MKREQSDSIDINKEVVTVVRTLVVVKSNTKGFDYGLFFWIHFK